ncbi:MAG: CinA family protein [Actinomycetaceae bacterium]|nr:CinA family protein [Actinomycetaceae bacterium]
MTNTKTENPDQPDSSPQGLDQTQGREVATYALAAQIVELLTKSRRTIAVAESLTAGMVSASLADVPGASNCLRGGVTTYQTHTKASVLGVGEARLKKTGPVDPEVAKQMARGVAKLFDADFGVATTGVAGPGPSDGHEAGTVYVGVFSDSATRAELFHFEGKRPQVREQATAAALAEVRKLL